MDEACKQTKAVFTDADFEAEYEQLVWHCSACGGGEPAQPEYEHGEWEPCIDCADGVSRVMMLKEAAAIESRVARGKPLRDAPTAEDG